MSEFKEGDHVKVRRPSREGWARCSDLYTKHGLLLTRGRRSVDKRRPVPWHNHRVQERPDTPALSHVLVHILVYVVVVVGGAVPKHDPEGLCLVVVV